MVVERGDEVLPCLGKGGTLLAYGHQLPRGEKWQLVVTSLDGKTGKTGDKRVLALDAEPRSISWDPRGHRWLVVTTTKMLWVQDLGERLVASDAAKLRWGQVQLRPTGASVSPDGTAVAIAAELVPPQVFPEEEVRVLAGLFLWPGDGAEAKPLLDLRQIGLPRWRFPASGSP